MKSLEVGVQYQPFAEQSIIWKVNGVVSLDTPSAFVQSICVLLEIESLLVYLKTARTLASDLCLFFLELHLPNSFVSTDWSGDSLLVFGSIVSNKARNPLIPDGCSIAASAHHVRYLFQWWLLVLPWWLWPQLASLWSDLSQYLEATVVDVLTIEVHASTGLLSQINDHLGFRDRQGCPFNSCPWSSELDFPQIVCNFHPIWSNVGLYCCRANHTRSWLGILVGLPSRCPQGWLPCAQRLTQALVWLNIYSPAGTLRLPDLGWCQTVCVWLHTRLLNCLYYQHLRSMRPQGEPETQVPNGETRVSTTNTETPTTHRTTSTSNSKESVLYDGVYSVRRRQSNILHYRQCK